MVTDTSGDDSSNWKKKTWKIWFKQNLKSFLDLKLFDVCIKFDFYNSVTITVLGIATQKSSHYLFTIMNHQRISTFSFCSPVLLGIHRNSDWKEFLKSCESFLRKSQFSKMRYLNPGFGGPWDMLGIFFVNVIFITLQKKSFGQKLFWIPCTGSKVPFWQFFNSGKKLHNATKCVMKWNSLFKTDMR